MGSFDGTEIYELVGLYIQSKLEKIFPKSKFGLHRDDGLALLRNLNWQQSDIGKTSSEYLKISVLASDWNLRSLQKLIQYASLHPQFIKPHTKRHTANADFHPRETVNKLVE